MGSESDDRKGLDGGLIQSPDGLCTIEYSLSQPAPTQWVAAGFASVRPWNGATAFRHLVIGTGPTREDAIRRLHQRCPKCATPEQSGV